MTELLLAPLQALSIFIAYPWLAAVIGAAFVTLGWKARRWGVVTIGVVWVLYAAYETGIGAAMSLRRDRQAGRGR